MSPRRVKVWVGVLALGAGAVLVGWLSAPLFEPEARDQQELLSLYLTPEERAQLGLPASDHPPRVLDSLEIEALRLGCPVVDCISAIDGPAFESAAQADRWLRDDDRVLSLTLRGTARAYPLRILSWHEVVNDRLAGEPILVSYCPLCGTGMAFVRPVLEGEPLEFGVSGRLYRSDLVMFDRATGTFWSQIEGRALIGPLVGRALERLPVDVLSWEAWRAAHPGGQVLSRPTFDTPVAGRSASGARPPAGLTRTRGRFLFDYDEEPYSSYRADPEDTFGTPFADGRLSAKAEVLGLSLAGEARAYPARLFTGRGVLHDALAGTPLALVWEGDRVQAVPRGDLTLRWQGDRLVDQRGRTWRWGAEGLVEADTGRTVSALPLLRAYWFAWLAFHPRTTVFELTRRSD